MILVAAAARAEVPATDAAPTAPAQAETQTAPEKPAEETAACKPGDDVLGVSRTIEIDATGGPRFGDQYPPESLLKPGEVAITFDDGPHPTYTKEILDALAAQCTKATFFNVGEMVKQYPDMAKQVEAAGHTIGTHTWSHKNLGAISLDRAKEQIESTFNIENQVLKNGVAPFFRFPYLSDPKRVQKYLAERNVAIFGIDVDSLDYRVRTPEKVVSNIMKGLEKSKGGILLFHDIHPWTAKAIPEVLKELKAKGYKVVFFKPKTELQPLAQYTEPAKTKAHVKKRARHAYRSRTHKRR
jgi:peptidoglycan/xylan/chitin deacetylase (PgdA/CDA1 family)